MKQKTVNDLIPNTDYYIILSPLARTLKTTYLGCVKESYGCNFYFKFLEGKGYKGSISTFGMDEIGIGRRPEEAKGSYGAVKHELPIVHFDSEKEISGLENHPSK